MAQEQRAYDFSLFDTYDYGTSAPKFEPEYEPEQPKKKQSKPKETNKVSKSVKEETKRSHKRAMKAIAVCFAVAAVFTVLLSLNAINDELATDINKTRTQIDIAMSENVRLTSALEGLASIDKVEDYAENVLGMVKLEDYRITYFNTGEDSQVVVSGGKTYSSNTLATKFQQLKEYFSK